MKVFTESDMRKAAKVGKRSCSFQFIEGQEPRNQLNADDGFGIDYCTSLIANIMAKNNFKKTPEEIAEGIKRNLLSYYRTITGTSGPKESEEPKKEGAE